MRIEPALGAPLLTRLQAALNLGQSTRLLHIETALPSASLVVERCCITEAVHATEPLWAEVDCVSTHALLELKALNGEQVTLRLLLTTSSRAAQGASVASTQMDAAEAVAQLRAARQLGEALSQSARQQGAQGLHSHDGAQAWQHHTDQMDPQAQGRYEGSVGGQEAKKAQGRALTDPVERFAKPLLHLDTPVSASFVTPTSIHLFSGQDTSLSAQGDVHSTSAHSFSAVSGQTTSLYTHSGGIKAITANAGLSLRAHTDAQQIWSEKDLTVQSTTDEIRVQASKSITLTAGQSQIVIEGGNITFTCPGTWTVKGAGHDWSGGGGFNTSLEALPDSRVKMFDEAFVIRNQATGQPIPNQKYRIRLPDGTLEEGVTDSQGRTHVIRADAPHAVQIEIAGV